MTSTRLSEAIQLGDAAAGSPEWHRVNTFSPGTQYSPHYAFHGAIGQAQTLAAIWSMSAFTPAAHRESALRLLAVWQRGRCYGAARPYLVALTKLASARAQQDPPQPIDVQDLPPDEPGSA